MDVDHLGHQFDLFEVPHLGLNTIIVRAWEKNRGHVATVGRRYGFGAQHAFTPSFPPGGLSLKTKY